MREWLQLMAEYGWYLGIPLLFVLIVFFVYRPKRRNRFRKDADIPFRDKKHKHD